MKFSRELQYVKNIYHYLQAQLWRAYYGWPDKQLRIYGITGTNGKTTTAIVLGTILRAHRGQQHVGLFSTEVFWIGEVEEPNETHMTSIDARILFASLRTMVRSGVTDVVLELTSHALHQHRLAGISLSGAIITNITHEHLDYHHTMEAYSAAKAKIADYLRPDTALVVNTDDSWVQKVCRNIRRRRPDLQILAFTAEQAAAVKTLLPGDFNRENVLAATVLARHIGIDDDTITRALGEIRSIPGRMEYLEHPRGFKVLIDFALTPDALERLYRSIKPDVIGRLVAVFGAAGQRDRTKRPLLTQIAAKYVDELVLTQDEPYTEPEQQIYAELEAGLVDATVPWRRIEDRREALAYAISKAQAGDVVVVTGMGNYHTRVVGTKHVPWNDKAVVLELFKLYP